MSERKGHLFEFQADEIANAAAEEADYHRERAAHWEGRRDEALERVRETIGARVAESVQTGGQKNVQIVVDYGDPEAWQEYQLAHRKVDDHLAEAARFASDAATYASQHPGRVYELDAEDVHHFRLGGEARPE